MSRWQTFEELQRLDDLRHSAKNAFIQVSFVYIPTQIVDMVQEILSKLDEMALQQQKLNDELDQAKYLNKNYQIDLRKLGEEHARTKRLMVSISTSCIA